MDRKAGKLCIKKQCEAGFILEANAEVCEKRKRRCEGNMGKTSGKYWGSEKINIIDTKNTKNKEKISNAPQSFQSNSIHGHTKSLQIHTKVFNWVNQIDSIMVLGL